MYGKATICGRIDTTRCRNELTVYKMLKYLARIEEDALPLAELIVPDKLKLTLADATGIAKSANVEERPKLIDLPRACNGEVGLSFLKIHASFWR